jgi:hypothetical protein
MKNLLHLLLGFLVLCTVITSNAPVNASPPNASYCVIDEISSLNPVYARVTVSEVNHPDACLEYRDHSLPEFAFQANISEVTNENANEVETASLVISPSEQSLDAWYQFMKSQFYYLKKYRDVRSIHSLPDRLIG